MTDEKFFAWLDDELPADEAAEVATAVAADPALAAQAEQHRALTARLKTAFDPVMAQPAPVASRTNVIDLAAARQRRGAWLPARAQWAALAATLAVGVLTTSLFLERGVSQHGDQSAVASGALGTALDTQLASAPEAGSAVRIGLSFRDKSGAMCRSFTKTGASGLACHESGSWHVRGIFATGNTADAASDYRMAAGPDPRLAALINQRIAGDPFDAAAEARARAAGWR